MEDFYPPTQQDRYESADYILAQIGCGRYDTERRDSAIISDLLLVIERMSNKLNEVQAALEESVFKISDLESKIEYLNSDIKKIELKGY